MIKRGFGIIRRAFHVRSHGFRQYKGDAKQICEQIVKDCWNGKYFQTSAGHFSEFWSRDFGWCVDSLLKLGYKDEVIKTLDYALHSFEKVGKVTTTILPNGKPYDFFKFAPDSLPFIMRSLNAANAKHLITKYRSFLQHQIIDYERIVIDQNSGLVHDRKFSSMRDGVYRNRSAYDTSMAGMLANEADKAGLVHGLPDMKKILLKHYWAGSHFRDDLSKKSHITGDAQLFPFWTGVITDKEMMKKAFSTIKKSGLDSPFPLKYVYHHVTADEMVQRLFVPNYEGNTIWAHQGMLYIQSLNLIDPARAKQHIKKYAELVENYGTFLEVYEPDGSLPYQSLFYASDEAMLWAANLRVLLTHL